MKKVLYTLGILGSMILFAACNKVQTENTVASPLTIGATISAADEADDTKVDLNTTTGKMSWKAGDKIVLSAKVNATTYSLDNTFTLNSGSGAGTATFFEDAATPVDWSGISASNYAQAFYGPTTSYLSLAAGEPGWWLKEPNPASAGAYTGIFLPDAQTYVANGPKEEYLYMASNKITSVAGLKDITFSNVLSIVRIPVKKSTTAVTLNSIELSIPTTEPDAGYEKPLVGRWYVTNGKNIISVLSSSTYGKANWAESCAVSLTSINTSLTTDVQYFYIVIAPGEQPKPTVKLNGTVAGSPVSKTFTYSKYLVTKAGHIYTFPELNWDAK